MTFVTVGLTGGIASGKSTVSNYFRELGAYIVDADAIAKRVVEKGEPAWEAILREFGNDILLEDKSINRDTLGEVIFNDSSKKAVLNSIVHPHVFKAMEQEKNTAGRTHKVVILDVPLLFETKMDKDLDAVIVVYTPKEIQLERLIKRDNLAPDQARARIASQLSIEDKKQMASIVVDNSGGVDDTRQQVQAFYKTLAK